MSTTISKLTSPYVPPSPSMPPIRQTSMSRSTASSASITAPSPRSRASVSALSASALVPSQPSKASLGFICSPSGPSTSASALAPAQTTAATATTTTAMTARRRSQLDKLPKAALSNIAFHLVDKHHHPSALVPLLLTCKSVHEALAFDNDPELYNRLFRATFDTPALDRRYEWMRKHLASVATRGKRMFDLFADPKSWAIEYKTRWELTWRMRQVVKHGKLEVPGVCTWDQLEGDLWNVWFLLTENDGRNARFLADRCRFQDWMIVYYREDFLKKSLVPGYPPETGAKALAMWCALLSGVDTAAENTAQEVDEKIFICRPFVFANAKYDFTYAPWTIRQLPTCQAECKDHEPDLTLRAKALPYQRFGYTWRRAPPLLILGMYLAFLRLLERQPGRMGLKPGSSAFASTEPQPGLFSVTRILPAIYHDREWQRNTVCQDPHTSPGLPALTFRGEVEGFWRAKYLFYDFELYRHILAGNMRSVYTGTFAEQVVEMEIKETVIKVRKEDVGGKGSMLAAGFDDEGEGIEGLEKEQQRILEGYGHELCKDESAGDEPGWTKEILLSGVAKSSWGLAFIRGRVRAWDGLVILTMSYAANRTPLGRWLWRGYIHTGGHLVGRWRDTFTPEHLRGYEGAFGMIRAGDVFYPPHFPKTMAESQGIVHTGFQGTTPIPPHLPSVLQPPPVAQSDSSKTAASSPSSTLIGTSATSSRSASPARKARAGPTWNTGPARKRSREE